MFSHWLQQIAKQCQKVTPCFFLSQCLCDSSDAQIDQSFNVVLSYDDPKVLNKHMHYLQLRFVIYFVFL